MQSALVIDDDPLFHIVAEAMLSELGVGHIDHAEDGVIGLEKLSRGTVNYELVLCDLQMPNLDGVSVVRELSQIDFRGALIIVSSEDSDIVRTVKAMAQMAGVRIIGTLAKPLEMDGLRGLFEALPNHASNKPATVITRHQLKTAMANGGLIPFYQPKLDMRTGLVTGVEVLARAIDKHGQPGSPEPYLAAAEKQNLMLELTLVMFEHVVAHSRRWRADGIELDLAINISPASLGNLDLPDMIASRCQAAEIDPRTITLEITENRFLDYQANVLDVLSRIRLQGFRLSMDDFGTGATSIEQMRLYPFNELKIDKSFVQGAQTDEFALTTVETSARLAAMLGLKVVAEGVETAEHLALAKRAGAEIAQGFLISKAMPGDQITQWISQYHARKRSVA